MVVTVEAQRLRRDGETGLSRPPSARLLVAAAVGVLGVGSGPALAQGSRPEKPPVKAPVSLGPEPAPAAKAAPAPTVSTSAPARRLADEPGDHLTTLRRRDIGRDGPSVVTRPRRRRPSAPDCDAEAKPKPPPPAPASPKATKAVKSFAHAISRSATRLALGWSRPARAARITCCSSAASPSSLSSWATRPSLVSRRALFENRPSAKPRRARRNMVCAARPRSCSPRYRVLSRPGKGLPGLPASAVSERASHPGDEQYSAKPS